MKQLISSFKQVIRKGIILFALVCLFNIVSWFGIPNQPSYATLSTEEAFQEIEQDQGRQDPEKAYEQATKVDQDTKMGEEKKFEENLQEYYKENPDDKQGIVGEVKGIVDKVVGNEE